jgi:hypothetical protein
MPLQDTVCSDGRLNTKAFLGLSYLTVKVKRDLRTRPRPQKDLVKLRSPLGRTLHDVHRTDSAFQGLPSVPSHAQSRSMPQLDAWIPPG